MGAGLSRVGGIIVSVVAVALLGCATSTPPPRFSSQSPADASAPEAAIPPAPPVLTGKGELAERAEPSPSREPAMGHEGHSAQGTPSAGTASPDAKAETYTCPMHPQVTAKAPGACPICGMPLVESPASKPEDPRK